MDKLKKLHVVVWHGKQETPVTRARVSCAGAVKSALGVSGCGLEVFVLASCLLIVVR
jgi:hypothetical protein